MCGNTREEESGCCSVEGFEGKEGEGEDKCSAREVESSSTNANCNLEPTNPSSPTCSEPNSLLE